MTPNPTCLRCWQVISPADTIELDGDRVVHLDCRRPRRLTFDEQALLYQYCWDHAVGECVSCARSVRTNELLSSPDTDLCPQCRTDLTDGVRAHLYSCTTIPADVRRRAQEARAAGRKLVKQRGQADVLMPEAEVAMAELRDATKQSALERLRRIIRVKLRDGSLPVEGIPATILGRPGDDSSCGACDHLVTSRNLMMVVLRQASTPSAPHQVPPIPFHADCFELWNEERRTFKPSS